MRAVVFLLSIFLAATAVGARAQQAPIVLELYTSQGCSSCPPADALLRELDARAGVIALALHVDYWDYLGWHDTFAKRAFTARQRGYTRTHGYRSVYTPQIIIHGNDMEVGHAAGKILAKIAKQRATVSPVALRASRKGPRLTISAEAASGVRPGPLDVHVVRFEPSKTVRIDAGENAGRELAYTNIVMDWDTVAAWNPASPLDLQVALPDQRPLAVIIQEPDFGPIVAATDLR